jgi:anaerobic ribonucleoside-triphosphate reductase activating protein
LYFQCAGITDSVVDGYGIAYVVWFSGCNLKCYKCQNPDLQNHLYGYQETTENIIKQWQQNFILYDSMVYLGGEPMIQEDALYKIAKNVNTIKWLYTGFTSNQISNRILKIMDVIVCGPYNDNLKTNSFPASSNQEIIFQGELINANKSQLRERIRSII